MMSAYVLMFKGLLAGVSCALAGLAVYHLLNAAMRVWPELAARRAVWLAAQIVVAAAALLPFLPHGEQISVAPAVTLGAEESSVIRRLALKDGGDRHGGAEPRDAASDADTLPPSMPAPSALAVGLPMLWTALYAAGLAYATVLQTVFWFNPALRWLAARMTWALELACDQRVLAGRPQQQRKRYAAALLQQWKAQAAMPPGGGLAFGGIHGDTVAARILHMQKTSLPALNTVAAWTVAVKAGDRADQLSGGDAVGETDFATGPHLHFEVRRHNLAINPATLLADLDAHATRRALKARRQQQGY